QNITPSPALWDILLTGGVPLLLALAGAVVAVRRRSEKDMLLLAWLGLGALALYAPFALQRRLSLGLWMPVVLLAATGLHESIWPRLRPALRPLAVMGLALPVAPSNLLVYFATVAAVQPGASAICP